MRAYFPRNTLNRRLHMKLILCLQGYEDFWKDRLPHVQTIARSGAVCFISTPAVPCPFSLLHLPLCLLPCAFPRLVLNQCSWQQYDIEQNFVPFPVPSAKILFTARAQSSMDNDVQLVQDICGILSCPFPSNLFPFERHDTCCSWARCSASL